MFKKLLKNYKGFTLIELLIVIAILGVLAAVVLVAIDPLEQLARSRDSGRVSSITQLGNAVSAYYTGVKQGVSYASWTSTWISDLKSAGELKTIPVNAGGAGYTVGCNNAATADDTNGHFCYATGTVSGSPESIVYARAESKADKSRASNGSSCAGESWVVWTSVQGKTGLVCTSAGTDPAVGTTVY